MFTSSPIDISAESRARILQGDPMLDNVQGLVVISERNYREMARAINNVQYLKKLDESFAQFERGETISFNMEELEAMAADDWKPTKKVLDFLQRTHHE